MKSFFFVLNNRVEDDTVFKTTGDHFFSTCKQMNRFDFANNRSQGHKISMRDESQKAEPTIPV